MKKLVFYHSKCLDGFTGAWAVWKKLKDTAEYRGLSHEISSVPSGITGRDIIFVDYCFNEEVMKKIKKKVKSLTILDHHISHEPILDLADAHSFSLKKSGCVLAWEYFHPKQKVPQFLLTVQDVDLFTMTRPKTREIAIALMLYDFDFKIWDKLVKDFADTKKRKKLIELGELLISYRDKYIAKLLEIAEPVTLYGHKAYAVNTHVFYSEVGSRMYETLNVPLGITWYYKDGKIKVSLRSDGSVDVSKIAMKHGGGGHVGAAGFWLDFAAPFPWTNRTK